MKFNECYDIIDRKFQTFDLSKIDTNFSAIVCFTDDTKNYIYIAYVDGRKIIEPVKHDGANIVVSLSTDTFEKILNKSLDPFKAFTTGKIKAKGNVFLALSLFKKLKS